MKVKTLLKYLEPYKEADIYFGSDEQGTIFFNACDIETDKKKILIYPFGKEMEYKKFLLEEENIIRIK